MNVLSLFDGISVCQLALTELGVPIDHYYASEIDKYASAVTRYNFPNTIHLGDVTNWRDWDIDWASINLVTGGFPCPSWSMAGKQQGDKDPRGMLFWVMLDIIKHIKNLNPNVKFLIENVRMKKEFEEYITFHTSAALGNVDKYLINSALVSAQNRQRYYWLNCKNITQPTDLNVLLEDIIEDGMVDLEKSHCIDANYAKGANWEQYKAKSRRQLVITGGAMRGRYLDDNGKRLDSSVGSQSGLTKQRIEIRTDGKSNCLTTVQKDSLVAIIQRSRGFNKGGIFTEKSPTMTANSWQDNNHLTDGITYRKLTPRECERLQTIRDDFTSMGTFVSKYGQLEIKPISPSQRYRQLGNSWTNKVIKHILNHLLGLNNEIIN